MLVDIRRHGSQGYKEINNKKKEGDTDTDTSGLHWVFIYYLLWGRKPC